MKIEGFELLDELSRGPITTVYRGKQSALDRPVLIKVLNTQWRNDEELIERFRREALICARLKHPNIISIFDVSTEKDALYMIIEFVEGNPLDEFIELHSPLPFDIIRSISRGILSGLQYAHQHQVIHRDIKPANILISSEGRARIVDFGLATVADLPKVTAQYGTVGTPAYMSPEQISGHTTSSTSDIFSCGITFYEMAVGKSPFFANSAAECMQRILNEMPAPPDQIRTDLPAWYSNMVMEMLQKDASTRPGEASELLSKFDTHATNPDSPEIARMVLVPPQKETSAKQTTPPSAESMLNGLKMLLIAGLLITSFLIAFASHQWRTPISEQISEQQQTTFVDTLKASSDIDIPVIEPLVTPAPTSVKPKESTATRAKQSNSIKQLPPKIQPGQTTVPLGIGFLYVACNPWGVIYLNGIEYDTTPMINAIELPVGRHLVEVRNPNYQSYIDSLTIQANRTDSLAIDLSPLLGYLELTVIPWANVHLNGRFLETTPLSEALELPQGKHLLKLSNPNFQTWEDSIEIVAEQVTQKRITLTP